MAAIRCSWAFLLMLLFCLQASAQDLTLDQILQKNEEVLGGSEALSKVQTLRMINTVAGSGLRNTLYLKYPNNRRSELLTARGMSMINANDGEARWSFSPLSEPKFQISNRKIPDGWFESALASQIHWLAGIKAAGSAIELIGKDSVKDSPAYKLKVTSKNGESTIFFLDAKTFLTVKIVTRMDAGTKYMEVEAYPGDYKTVGGITFAHSNESKTTGEYAGSSREIYEEIAVNIPLDDSLFKAPTEEMLAEMTRGMTLKGKLENINVHGESLVGNLIGDSPERPVTVYLPPSYDKEPNLRYPVIYMLHGFGGNNDQWTKPALPNNITIAAEKAFSAGAREMILVIPSAYTAFIGSMFSNSATTGDWESFIANDLVAYVDSHYRTIPGRASRGLAGHSMGGYGTIRIGMKHPEVFSSMYGLSPCCMPPTMQPQPPLMAQAGAIKSLAEIKNADFAVQAMIASAAAWSPNPKRPPFFLDLPMENGKARPDIIAKWAANAPLTMVHQYIPNLKKYHAIAFDIGDKDVVVVNDDEDVMLQASKNLDRILTDYGVEHTFEIYDGDHTNRIPDRVETKVIPFFSKNLVFE